MKTPKSQLTEELQTKKKKKIPESTKKISYIQRSSHEKIGVVQLW